MKVVVGVIAACVLGLACAERCPGGSISECVHTSCDSSSELHCIDNICECTVTGPAQCPNGTKAECEAIQNWNCAVANRHCVDQQCVCRRIQGTYLLR